MICEMKHTKYQPTEEDWRCPKCGSDQIYIDDSVGFDDCSKLHDEDYITCYNCDFDATGKKFADMIQKKKSLVTCPYCKGTGLVKKEKP